MTEIALRARRYGAPDYALLDMRCAPEIRQAGSDGGEVGVMHDLWHGQRESNLVSCYQDHLRFGISLNLIYVT